MIKMDWLKIDANWLKTDKSLIKWSRSYWNWLKICKRDKGFSECNLLNIDKNG